MYNKNLWDLFFTTGDLNFYLELKKVEMEKACFKEEYENINFEGIQNILLR